MANPLADPLRFERRVPECAIVIFGANGDLTKRKLLPALYRLAYERRLPGSFAIIGNSRTPMSDEDFRGKMHDEVKQFLEDSPFDEDLWTDFVRKLYYVAGDIKDPKLYSEVSEKLDELGQKNVLFYLSTQPSFYAPIIEQLGQAELACPPPDVEVSGHPAWRRIVIEKPFGHDLESAQDLNGRHPSRRFRSRKSIASITTWAKKRCRTSWPSASATAFSSRCGIAATSNHVQITAAESIGVEGRGAYYQEAGALRDMIQNHLLQVAGHRRHGALRRSSSPMPCAMSAPSCSAPSGS